MVPTNRRLDYQMAKDRLHYEMRKAEKDLLLERKGKGGLLPNLAIRTEPN